MYRKNAAYVLAALALIWVTAGCSEKRLTGVNRPDEAPGPCVDDGTCEDGFICVLGECVDIGTFDCVGDTASRVLIQPTAMSFGEIAMGNSADQTVTISNDGECNLTVEAVGLADGSNAGFRCSPCDLTSYPYVIPPRRTYDVNVSYSPVDVGAATGQLLIRSDAQNAGTDGVATIDLAASYSGVPVLVLDPPELNFGYVSYTAGGGGGSRTETIRITNQGNGNAVLRVEFVYVRPGTDITIPTSFGDISPASPVLLAPYNVNDPDTWIDVPVTYAPTRNEDIENQLTVQAHAGDDTGSVNVTARLAGSSLGPPAIVVTPQELVFQDPNGEPLNLGRTAYHALTISNVGQSELTVDLGLDDTTGDFSFSPSHLPPLAAGATVSVSILYTPTVSSDLTNPSAPQTSTDAFFRIVSNDTNNLLTTVRLRGWAKSGISDDILKVEMTFENNDNSWSSNDFRNVDLELESPLGYSCKKPRYEYTQQADGSYTVTSTFDFCEQWNETGLQGTSTWIPGGAFEEPERVLLYGLGQDLANDQDFRVMAHYVEDCANIPTGLLADLAGIGVSTLLGILGGQVGVPIAVPPDSISGLIEENCWDHRSSLVTVTVFINTREVATRQITLASKGDAREVLRIHRQDGTFTVTP